MSPSSVVAPSRVNFALTEAPILRKKFLNPKTKIRGYSILSGASNSNSMCKSLHPVSALQDCLGVEMPLSPLVSVAVPAVSVAVQDLLSRLAQPFSFLAVHRTSEPNHGNSRRV